MPKLLTNMTVNPYMGWFVQGFHFVFGEQYEYQSDNKYKLW